MEWIAQRMMFYTKINCKCFGIFFYFQSSILSWFHLGSSTSELGFGLHILPTFIYLKYVLDVISLSERRHAKRGLNVINDVPRKWRRKLMLIYAPILFITRVSNFAVSISCTFSPGICLVCIEVFPTEGPSYPIISHTTILFTLTTDKQKKFT